MWWRICTLPPRNNGWLRWEPPCGPNEWWYHVLSSAQQALSSAIGPVAAREGYRRKKSRREVGQAPVHNDAVLVLPREANSDGGVRDLDFQQLKQVQMLLASLFLQRISS